MLGFGSTRTGRRDGVLNGDVPPHNGGDPITSVTSLKPDSGLQLLIVLGAGFLAAGIRPDVGMLMLMLGIGAWVFYNIVNAGRQF
jgi:hypothetical protein